MKNLYLLFLLVFLSCDSLEVPEVTRFIPVKDTIKVTNQSAYLVVEIEHENCQYILIKQFREAGLAHKGNCTNPVHADKTNQ